MTNTDTDSLLDRCAACGARAGFEQSDERPQIRARCTECCACGEWHHLKHKDLAVTEWNQAQRHTNDFRPGGR